MLLRFEVRVATEPRVQGHQILTLFADAGGGFLMRRGPFPAEPMRFAPSKGRLRFFNRAVTGLIDGKQGDRRGRTFPTALLCSVLLLSSRCYPRRSQAKALQLLRRNSSSAVSSRNITVPEPASMSESHRQIMPS